MAIAAVGQSIAIEDKARELSGKTTLNRSMMTVVPGGDTMISTDVKEKIKDSNIPLAELDREVAELEEYMRSFEVANGDITRLAAEIYVIIDIWHSVRSTLMHLYASAELLTINLNSLAENGYSEDLHQALAGQ